MGQCNFESTVKTIPYSSEAVYSRISDLRNLEKIREHLSNPAVEEAMSQQILEDQRDKVGNLGERMKDLQFDADTVTFGGPMGNITLRIIERDEFKCIKFAAEGSPIEMNMWIQLLPLSEDSCKLKVTIHADLNMFIKGMVSKPLQQGVEKFAEILAVIPYNF